MSIKYIQSPTLYQAGSGSVIGATSIVLTSLTDIYGNVLTMTDFGSLGYGTCEPDSSNAEAFTFTGVTANGNGTYSLTGVKTALAKSPYTQTSQLIRQHAGGTKVVITDNVAFWNTFANINNDALVTGTWGSAVVPSADTDYTNKAYVDTGILAGAPNASTTAKGIIELATQTEYDARNTTGGTGAKLVATPDITRGILYNDYAADSVGTDSYVITVTPAIAGYVTGQVFVFKAGTANTGACSLNVNAKGVVAIKKDVSTDLATGDILANQIVTVIYDGTNMQMVSHIPQSTIPIVRTYLNAGSPATWTKPTGLKYVMVEVQAGGGGGYTVAGGSTGGGGGGGGYSRKLISVAILGTTEIVTTGAGGTKDADGGTSSFGVHLTASGGIKGTEKACEVKE